MDALIVLFIIGGIIVSLASKSKKQKKQNPEAEKPAAPAPAPAPEKIPYTKEEWAKYLREMGIGAKGAAAAKTEAPPKPAAGAAFSGEGAVNYVQVKPSAPPAGSPEMAERMRRAVEQGMPGSVAVQGESEAEHAEHLEKMRAADLQAHQQSQTVRELRQMNRARLRQAVVMREILDRPVSMRGE